MKMLMNIGREKSIPFDVQGMIDEMLEIAPMTGGEHGEHMELEKKKKMDSNMDMEH
ncbi:hypothetical protein [Laceyella putida]|uniref:Uncharacterized protein n=1 Tax=Laceyella putida TaxID=110101 RepID=A0ABW2RLW5_9BACL